MKKRVVALVLALSSSLAFAQVGQQPGVTQPPGFTGGTITSRILAPTGCATPGYGFSGDANAGLCLDALNLVRLQSSPSGAFTSVFSVGAGSTNAIYTDGGGMTTSWSLGDNFFNVTNEAGQSLGFDASALSSTLPFRGEPDECTTVPFSFSGWTTSGLGHATLSDSLYLCTGGARKMGLTAIQNVMDQQVVFVAGSAAAPGGVFSGGTTTGFFGSSTFFGLSVLGVERARLDNLASAFSSTYSFHAPSGTDAAPGFAFSAETDLGCHRSAPNEMRCRTGSGNSNAEFRLGSAFGLFVVFDAGGANSGIQISDGSVALTSNGVTRATVDDAGIRGSAGTAVASAATIAASGNIFHVTGTTTITSVSIQLGGTIITIIFDGALTFTDGSNLRLAGDFVTTADDTITLMSDGSNWYEIARSVN